jgi:hypothetical protein
MDMEPMGTPDERPRIPTSQSQKNSQRIEDRLDRERGLLRNNVRLYIKSARPIVEPTTVYLENWHIDQIAE